ncbi:MAG: DRTGG domain-containing protein, partial [Methanomassiliicoccales archaeon]
MKAIYLGAVVERAGKTMVSLGLAKNCPGRVGYFKPFKEDVISVDDRLVDMDAHLMKKALNLGQDEEALSPIRYDLFKPALMDKLLSAYERVKCECDYMLIEGARIIQTGYLHDVSGLAFSEAVGADVVLVSTSQPQAIESVGLLKRLMESYEVNFRGVILNKTDDPAYEALLAEKGIPVLGSIPTLRELKYYRVKEVADALGADVIVGEQGLDKIVEEVMIGAMRPETAIKYLRRVARKAVITGGDRSDIQIAALSTDTSCLILTGGLYPEKTVIAKAYEEQIPVLLVRYDTATTAEMVEHLIARIDPDDKPKIDCSAKPWREHVDLSK